MSQKTPPIPGESRRRSVAKTISWRIVGSIDTLLLSFLVLTLLGPILGVEAASKVEHAKTASAIALAEVITKIALYYVHERIWARLRWARGSAGNDRRRRSVGKTASWRIIATMDTTLLAFLFTGNIGAAASIGGAEVATKLLLYYLHERAWARVPWS